MRRRLSLLFAPFVVLLALMLPASTLASGAYTSTTNKNYCTGYPAVVFKVTLAADGSTNANKLTIDGTGQTGQPGYWTDYDTYHKQVTMAAHTAGVVKLEVKYLGDAFARNRVVFKLHAWHNSTSLYSHKVVSVIC